MQFSFRKRQGGRQAYRSEPSESIVPEYWLDVNGAKEFMESHPGFYEAISVTGPNDVQVYPSSLFVRSHIEYRFTEQQRDSVDSLCSIIAKHYDLIAQPRYIRSFVAILASHFEPDATVAILQGMSNRCREESRRPFLSQSTNYMEWALYQLSRFIKTASPDQVAIFYEFVGHGGVEILSLSQLTRLVCCFLHEGCKVLVRLGIAFLLLDETSRLDDDLLFKKAFKVRISSRSYPLSERRRLKPRALWIPVMSERVRYEIQVPHISQLCELGLSVKQSMDALRLTYLTLSHRQVDLVVASQTDGTSYLLFMSRLNAAYASGSPFVIAVFQTTTGVLSLGLTSTSFVVLRGPTPSIVNVYSARSEEELVKVSGDFLAIVDDSAQPVLLTDKQLTRISLGDASDMSLVNYEIFQFI